MSYETARRDFEYLEAIAEVADMVEIDAAVFDLMRNPSKKTAAEMYRSCINLWFQEHGDKFSDEIEVVEIADRHDVVI